MNPETMRVTGRIDTGDKAGTRRGHSGDKGKNLLHSEKSFTYSCFPLVVRLVRCPCSGFNPGPPVCLMAGAAHCWKWAPEGASPGASAPAALHCLARWPGLSPVWGRMRAMRGGRRRAGRPLALGAMAPAAVWGCWGWRCGGCGWCCWGIDSPRTPQRQRPTPPGWPGR